MNVERIWLGWSRRRLGWCFLEWSGGHLLAVSSGWWRRWVGGTAGGGVAAGVWHLQRMHSG
jgi:hypothetical protein